MDKLSICLIGKIRDDLIDIISRKSDRSGDKLLDFLNKNNLISLQDATVEQLQSYISNYIKEEETKNDLRRIQK